MLIDPFLMNQNQLEQNLKPIGNLEVEGLLEKLFDRREISYLCESEQAGSILITDSKRLKPTYSLRLSSSMIQFGYFNSADRTTRSILTYEYESHKTTLVCEELNRKGLFQPVHTESVSENIMLTQIRSRKISTDTHCEILCEKNKRS